MTVRMLTKNAAVAAAYVTIALMLPATALANYRLATGLYVLAAWSPGLIPGLALGNALAGFPQGPVDVLMGGLVGIITAWACSKLGKLAPLAVLAIPTLLVPLWLGWMFGAPYGLTALVLLKGQAVGAALGWGLMQLPVLRRAARL